MTSFDGPIGGGGDVNDSPKGSMIVGDVLFKHVELLTTVTGVLGEFDAGGIFADRSGEHSTGELRAPTRMDPNPPSEKRREASISSLFISG